MPSRLTKDNVKWKKVRDTIFIILTRYRKKLTKEVIDELGKLLEQAEKEGCKFNHYWTLGRFDAVTIAEAPNEKVAMKALLRFGHLASTETLVAIPVDEAVKLVE